MKHLKLFEQFEDYIDDPFGEETHINNNFINSSYKMKLFKIGNVFYILQNKERGGLDSLIFENSSYLFDSDDSNYFRIDLIPDPDDIVSINDTFNKFDGITETIKETETGIWKRYKYKNLPQEIKDQLI
jgi:hypothetical protein